MDLDPDWEPIQVQIQIQHDKNNLPKRGRISIFFCCSLFEELEAPPVAGILESLRINICQF
jgi:hypothetical protein